MILFIISLAAFYLPYEISIIPSVIRILPYFRYICGGLMIIYFFLLYAGSLRVFRDNWYLWASAAFIAVLIYSTYINQADMESALGNKGIAAFFLVLIVAVFFKVDAKTFLLTGFFLLLLVNIANTYTVFAYEDVGMWYEWETWKDVHYSLVGNYNRGVEYVLPMAVCGSAYAMRYGKWLEFLNYPAMIMSIIMAWKCDSQTQIIVFAVILAAMIIGDIAMASKVFAKILRIFNPVIMVGLDAAIFIAVVLLNKTNWVEKIGLDPEFHGRRHIWNMALEWIHEKPVWGSGLETVYVKSSKIVGYAHCHSWFLDVAYMTGIVGSLCVIGMLVAVVIAIWRQKHDRLAYILSMMAFALCLTNLFETYTVTFFVFTLALIYYAAKCGSDTNIS